MIKKNMKPRWTKAEAPPLAKTIRAKAPKARRTTAPSEAFRVFIDFPQPDEVVRPGAYTFRLGTVPTAAAVDVSIDQGDWAACREAAGYWWFDWDGYDCGPHRIRARAHSAQGWAAESTERLFRVGMDAEVQTGGSAPAAEPVTA